MVQRRRQAVQSGLFTGGQLEPTIHVRAAVKRPKRGPQIVVQINEDFVQSLSATPGGPIFLLLFPQLFHTGGLRFPVAVATIPHREPANYNCATNSGDDGDDDGRVVENIIHNSTFAGNRPALDASHANLDNGKITICVKPNATACRFTSPAAKPIIYTGTT